MLRRALMAVFLGVSLVGTLGACAVPAHAQFDGSANVDAALQEQQATAAEQKAAATPSATGAQDTSASKIAITNPPDTGSAYGSVMQWIMKLFAWLVGVAAITLQNAVYYTVVTMGDYINKLSAIGVAWRILRDMGNIVLIFGFMIIGLSTILSHDIYGWGQKMLPKLLLAAVFVNFSLVAAEGVIDVGNLFATQFYTQINGGVPAKATDNNFRSAISNEGISNKIMAQVGLQNIYGNAMFKDKAFQGANSWLIGFMGIILFIVTAFVMFTLAFILIARFVILIFLIIVSPIGVAGLAVPKLDALAHKWWSTLVSETITAPVLLLLLYIALAVITDSQFLTGLGVNAGQGQFLGFIDNSDLAGFGATMLSFLIAMGLLLAVAIMAKRIGAFGSSLAMNAAGKLTGTLTFGGMSLAGRGTLGVAGYALNNKRVQAAAANGGVLGYSAKGAAFIGRNLEKRTYDFRNAPGAGLLQKAAGATGVPGLSGAFSGGAKTSAKDALDKTRQAVDTYKPFQGTWWRDQQKEYEKAAAGIQKAKNLDPDTAENADAFSKAVKKASVDELAELRGIRKGQEDFVRVLKPAQYSALLKSDKLLKPEKDALKKTWNSQFADDAIAANTISRLSTEEVATIESDILTMPAVIKALAADDMDAIMEKKALNREDRKKIYDTLSEAQKKQYFTGELEKKRSNFWTPNPSQGSQGGQQAPSAGTPPGYRPSAGGILMPDSPGNGPRPNP